MDGWIRIVPLLVLLTWLIPCPPEIAFSRAAASETQTPSHATSKQPSKKKPSPAKKLRAPKKDPKKDGVKLRRYAAEQALLRRLALAGLLYRPGSGESRTLEAWRIRLVDGDTFWYGAERIRIRGFDAPELSQPGGFDATRRLEALLHEGEIRMYPHGLDVYGRTLADVYVDQRNVAEVMTAEGYTKKR